MMIDDRPFSSQGQVLAIMLNNHPLAFKRVWEDAFCLPRTPLSSDNTTGEKCQGGGRGISFSGRSRTDCFIQRMKR